MSHKKTILIYYHLTPNTFGHPDCFGSHNTSTYLSIMRVFFIMVLLSFSIQVFGQGSSLFLEVGGSAGLGSINYERSLGQKNQIEVKWRAGFSYYRIDKNTGHSLIFPLLGEILVGKETHFLECGIGQTLTINTQGNFFLLTPVVLGYRFQPKEKKLFFRAAYTPIISYLLDFQYQNWGGLSIGYRFN